MVGFDLWFDWNDPLTEPVIDTSFMTSQTCDCIYSFKYPLGSSSEGAHLFDLHRHFFPYLVFEDNQACREVDEDQFDVIHLSHTLLPYLSLSVPNSSFSPEPGKFFPVFDVPRLCNLISVIPRSSCRP